MVCICDIFQVIIYSLLTILLIALIVLVLKLIKTTSKVNNVVNDVEGKVRKLNGIFTIIDNTTDALSFVGDKVVNSISNGISNIFNKNKKKEEDKKDE